MTARPHYHRCSECPASVLCTKQGEHDSPTCIKCRRAERDRYESVTVAYGCIDLSPEAIRKIGEGTLAALNRKGGYIA